MNKIGFMQGRLTNKGGFYPQEFPAQNWEREFETAGEIGFDCIEWMFNLDGWERNPIITTEGLKKISGMIEKTGVFVSGICANYFMKKCISAPETLKENLSLLIKLIENAKRLGCSNIILPLFEASEIVLWDDTFLKILEEISDRNVKLLLETDYELEKVSKWMLKTGFANVGICYDVGNAAGLGKNIVQELKNYIRFIENIHIKDKKVHGTTVMLGEGDAELKKIFERLCEDKYQGCLILESYYGADAIEDTRKNYNYVKDLCGK